MTQFKVRFAKESDKETVLAFCQNTWTDSDDYIHLVWDEWLEDSQGKIFVVTTLDDIPIAIRRVVLLSENESWWEGFRVAPNYIAIESPTKIDRQQLWIGYISGEAEILPTLLLELRKLAYTQKKSNVGLFVPCQENI